LKYRTLKGDILLGEMLVNLRQLEGLNSRRKRKEKKRKEKKRKELPVVDSLNFRDNKSVGVFRRNKG